jgi:hypothetical protein
MRNASHVPTQIASCCEERLPVCGGCSDQETSSMSWPGALKDAATAILADAQMQDHATVRCGLDAKHTQVPSVVYQYRPLNVRPLGSLTGDKWCSGPARTERRIIRLRGTPQPIWLCHRYRRCPVTYGLRICGLVRLDSRARFNCPSVMPSLSALPFMLSRASDKDRVSHGDADRLLRFLSVIYVRSRHS